MGAGNRIRPGVSGGKGKPVRKYSDRIYKVLLHLRDQIEGDRITGIADTAFAYLGRKWIIEPALSINRVRFYCVTRYNGQLRLWSDPAGRLLTNWSGQERSAYSFSQLCAELMIKERSTRLYRTPQKGDWKRIQAVRVVLDDEQRQELRLMTPSEQTRFYENHPAFGGNDN